MFRIACTLIAIALTNAALADSELPAFIIELPDSVNDVFIADAGDATLYRYENVDAEAVFMATTYMSIGQKGAGKERAWDRKTPLGIYFVVDQLDTSQLHDQYGVTAFPLDYPNTWDRRQQRTGDGIWVHGVLPGNGQRPPFDTDGCLALPNADLAALQDRFVSLVTPVIVTREMRWQSSSSRDALRDDLHAALGRWTETLSSGDVHGYLSLYANDFSYRGMSLGEWASFRFQTLAASAVEQLSLEEVLLLADPEEDGLYLSRFRQVVSIAGTTSTTIKRLYWRRDETGALKIVAEDNG